MPDSEARQIRVQMRRLGGHHWRWPLRIDLQLPPSTRPSLEAEGIKRTSINRLQYIAMQCG